MTVFDDPLAVAPVYAGPEPARKGCGLTPLDIAAGTPLGSEDREPLPRLPRGITRRQTLDDALLQGLEASPCLVAFSGGRDSSGMLAAAVDLARRRGLPDPVPVTVRLADSPTEDRHWQEEVVGHLGLDDWERIQIDDELDLVGPMATGVLRRHGTIFPANSCMLVPMLERAAGGALITHVGSQELFLVWHWARLGDVLARRARPRRSDLRIGALALLPAWGRAALTRRATPRATHPWLRPDAAREVARVQAALFGGAPVRFDAALRSLVHKRCGPVTTHSLQAMAADAGCKLVLPALDRTYLAALARDGGWTGWGDRTASMRAWYSHLLPDEMLTREEKVRPTASFFGSQTRAFAERWSGRGFDDALLDAEVLRDTWLGEKPDPRAALLVQSAWLHDCSESEASGGEQRQLVGQDA